MAEDEQNEQEVQNEPQEEQSAEDISWGDDEEGSGGAPLGMILRLLLPVCVLVIAAGGGYLASRLGGADTGPSEAVAEEEPPPPVDDGKEYAYLDMEPVVVNLSEPRLTRLISVTLTLAIRKEDEKKAFKVINKKMPELRNSVNLYLADCSLEEVRGAKNLNRILRDIQDSFNDRLWPKQRPLIVKVVYKKWVVQ